MKIRGGDPEKGSSLSTAGTTRVVPTGERGDAWSLRIIDRTLITSHSLPKAGTVILGRSHEADVQIESSSLSRKHAALHLGTPIRIEDLGSSNGTRVGGRALEERVPVVVRVGEPIELGSVLVIVEHDDAGRRADAEARDGYARNAGPPLAPGLERIAASTISVLLFGETGVGKEVMAETLHRHSPRAGRPMLRLNCAAFSEHLLESELFGHEKGAFTGADQAKPGLLETATGGTVFLDEVGELPVALQAKLLRVFEQREVMRVGGLRPRAIDVRFIAATNRDLEAEIAGGRFRQDLLFRLNGFSLTIPPLRERVNEIEPLARTFIAEASRRAGRARAPRLSAEVIPLLEAYAWPGNVRELRNVIERAVVLCTADVLGSEDLALDPPRSSRDSRLPRSAVSDPAASLRAELDAIERQRFIDALSDAGGNQSVAAKALGVSRGTFLARLDAFGIPRPRKRP